MSVIDPREVAQIGAPKTMFIDEEVPEVGKVRLTAMCTVKCSDQVYGIIQNIVAGVVSASMGGLLAELERRGVVPPAAPAPFVDPEESGGG